MGVTFLTNEDERRILDQTEAGKLLYTAQTLTDSQKAQARGNIDAAPAGYGWGEQAAAGLPGNDANNAVKTGLYLAGSSAANVPENCKMIFMQAVNGGYDFQTAYCTDGTVAMRMHDHGEWESWKPVYQNAKAYEKIATITVAPGEDGSLPKHVIFSSDSSGKSFALTDFMIKAYAGFADGSKSSLYMNVNGNGVITNGGIGSISSGCRGFNIFFRQEDKGFKRVEYTSSALSDGYYNAQTVIENSRLIPPISTMAVLPVTDVDLYTETGDTKAWVEGSTFELWGIRA
jgi:hypothetical protein